MVSTLQPHRRILGQPAAMIIDSEFNKQWLNGKPLYPETDIDLFYYLDRRSRRLGYTQIYNLLAYYRTPSGNLRAVAMADRGIERFVNYRDRWEVAQ